VILDRGFLETLDARHVSNGLAEVLRLALAGDRWLFELMERAGSSLITERLWGRLEHDQIFFRALQGKLDELEPDLWEDDLEPALWEEDLDGCADFGRSISPALERHARPELLRGEAVAIDMVLALLLARGRGLVTMSEIERVARLLRQLRLPLFHELLTADFVAAALRDAAGHPGGPLRLPLAVGIGDCKLVNGVGADELARALAEHRRIAAAIEALA
jgi:3-dehydroquinate synthase